MRYLDPLSRRILAICFGIGFVCFALAALFASAQPLFAQQSAEPPHFEEAPAKGGEGPFQVDLAVEETHNGVEYRAVVLNTRTAASRYYHYNVLNRAWELHPRQIPTESFE